MAWEMESADGFESRLRCFSKKHALATAQALENLSRYLQAVQSGIHPRQVTEVSIHPESEGVIAFDQTGSGHRKLHAVRRLKKERGRKDG